MGTALSGCDQGFIHPFMRQPQCVGCTDPIGKIVTFISLVFVGNLAAVKMRMAFVFNSFLLNVFTSFW